MRSIPVGRGTFQHEPFADVEILPGETTATTIGGDGYFLTAHLLWPDGWKPKAGQQVFAFIQTAPPPALAALVRQGVQGSAMAAQLQQSPEIQEFARFAESAPPTDRVQLEEATCAPVL